ncbi:uncharacterized protein BHQ10_008331 [Talaromyces amestolkiae]|uniref:RRM domain-containing protein n=1 Tax=Talaromyces amestolkiae TaxID=1196081 RepID=A0A364L962_TALAM|nr:uncharacterized protein BHQ10_008331 [Talaromyces amestolkiae]RAO72319.1 hypothetical protein BHQ10_008331 [Talaromyces amestolkiae]
MSKTKSATKGSKADKATDKVLSKVKDAGVTKASQSPKAKSKDIARKVKAKEEKASRKKKEPTPSSESESDSDEEMKEASSSESESESEEEKETKKPAAKTTKAAAKKDESSDSESESESESEDEKPAPKAKKAAAKEESSESESSDSESEEEVKTDKKAAAKEDASSDESDSSESESEAPAKKAESDSEDDSDSSESEEEKEAPKKRKAEEEPATNSKKSKTESADNSPNLFIGNLSWNIDEEWLRREFESFGELSGVRIMTERETGRSRGFGYVEYADASSAKAAYEAKKDTELDGRTINLDYAKPRDANSQAPREKAQTRARSFGDQTSPESNTLFIGNLVFGVDESAVREVFEGQGQIQGVRLPTDAETGRPKGYGYVEFSSVDEARQALNDLQGTDIGGRAIRLDYSTPRPQGERQGGGRGGFGGRGGRGGPRGGGGRGRGGFGGRGGRGGATGANSTNRGGVGEFSGKKISFD